MLNSNNSAILSKQQEEREKQKRNVLQKAIDKWGVDVQTTMTWQTILKAVHNLHDSKTRAVTAEEIEKIRPLYEKVKNEVRGQFGDNPANIAAQVNHILKGRRT